jgi:hypothetical protein
MSQLKPTTDAPHPPLRGTFSLGEKVAEGRMRGLGPWCILPKPPDVD